jgi:zeta-carotene isomerase
MNKSSSTKMGSFMLLRLLLLIAVTIISTIMLTSTTGGLGGGRILIAHAFSTFPQVTTTTTKMKSVSFQSRRPRPRPRPRPRRHQSLLMSSNDNDDNENTSNSPAPPVIDQPSDVKAMTTMTMEEERNDFTTATTQESSSTNDLPIVPFLTKTYNSNRESAGDLLVGEDAGVFDIQKEEWGEFGQSGWFTFSAAVAAILTAVAVLWVYPVTGYSDDLTHTFESLAPINGNTHYVTLFYGIIFPLMHSGLASLRPYGEQIVGARTWRVIFAFPSLCLSYSWITYFISHVHDGYQFYDLSHSSTAHIFAWIINFLSFFFLYPSVFNLKEVAAIEKPKLHLWETGIIRITRHPQFIGQCMWSVGHLIMVGTSFTALTMALLVGHHGFSCWNGDRRYKQEFGEETWNTVIKERTSVIPFQAIIEGRQQLPSDYYKELLRGPYFLIAAGTIGAYFAHPYMQGGAALVTNTGYIPGGIFG